MGKVLSSFNHGWPGTIARSVDDIVISMPNLSDKPIAYGMPVVLSDNKDGVIPFDCDLYYPQDFIGVTVRTPSKTPAEYGSSEGSYAPGEMVDILVRGHITVQISKGIPDVCDTVAIEKATNLFAGGSGQDYIVLPNAIFSATKDDNMRIEILLKERNLL